jgi:hypothetical protein
MWGLYSFNRIYLGGVILIGSPSSQKIVVELKGGLGNQMFQYAAGRSLALDNGSQLILDCHLGFWFDRRYRRRFELGSFCLKFVESSLFQSLPFLVNRVFSFIVRLSDFDFRSVFPRSFFIERNFEFVNLHDFFNDDRILWMTGYFQDPRYFLSNKEIIYEELRPPLPKSPEYIQIANLRHEYELIAIGIRFFEESPNPEAHARNGFEKTMLEYSDVIKSLSQSVKNPKFLVFSTEKFMDFSQLDLPENTLFITADRGFDDTLSTLWLLSMCRHHIFNNSTFYWWGAALSRNNYDDLEQLIFCSDNFLNPKIALDDWRLF